ncbi:hypothetical protein E7T06_05445 [Deinococcus sp. Arct2-2]|uniref:hypothetical protein n=1 Tax=Deinococcus sp. Arct2-2 TaxID=2568653 RepID=UPI0010A42752|nr:hypothetical protein [Deinococcus sp. Arct2-2]THF70797.1 hypothetical protein E7T06_05445 [Deinococcus sp. Arct2-2]
MRDPWSDDVRQRLEVLVRFGCEVRYSTDPDRDTTTPYSVEIYYGGERIAFEQEGDINTAAAFAYINAVARLRDLGLLISAE